MAPSPGTSLDLRVERALVIAQPGLDGPAEVVDEGFRLTRLQRVECGGGHGRRRDLLDLERCG
jgi:hypothetical protein